MRHAPLALIASPAHLALAGSASGTVQVTNTGAEPVTVDVTQAGFALDLRGRPRVVARPRAWLVVRPARLSLAPGAGAPVTVTSRVPRGAEPGDHPRLLLLTTRPAAGRALAVRVRLGVAVVVRVPGKVVRRVEILRARARRHRVEILLANRGNVSETVGADCMAVTLHRGAVRLRALRVPSRPLLPHASGLVELRYPRGLDGPATVRVALLPRCGGLRTRRFAVRL